MRILRGIYRIFRKDMRTPLPTGRISKVSGEKNRRMRWIFDRGLTALSLCTGGQAAGGTPFVNPRCMLNALPSPVRRASDRFYARELPLAPASSWDGKNDHSLARRAGMSCQMKLADVRATHPRTRSSARIACIATLALLRLPACFFAQGADGLSGHAVRRSGRLETPLCWS
jgi:hypothetical protein